MTIQELAAKYKPAAPQQPAPQQNGAVPSTVPMNVQQLAAKYKNYQAPTPAPTTMAQTYFGGTSGNSAGVAGIPQKGTPSISNLKKNVGSLVDETLPEVKGFGQDIATAINPNAAPNGQIPSNAKVLEDAGGTALDIASAGTYGIDKTLAMKTGELAEKAVPSVVSGAEKVGSVVKDALDKRAAIKNTAKTIEAVSPKLTTRETAEAVAKRGTVKTGLLRRIKTVADPAMKKVADAVTAHVPNFDVGKTFSENVNSTRDAVYKMADDLKSQVIKSGKDIIYPIKELASKMDEVEKPIAIKSDATLDRQFDLAKEAALKIAQKSGGKISNLLDARKEFDTLVQKQFPNLYDKENAPMRDAITSMRGVMNDFIQSKLPDVAFKDSLKAQSRLFTAIDNMSEKAAGEVDTNLIQRTGKLIEKHPFLSGILGGVGYNEARKVPIIGQFLP